MGVPSAGEVVLIPFPFSDLSQSKLRPAICLVPAGRGDWVLCQVTSNPYGDPLALPLVAADFAAGGADHSDSSSMRATAASRPMSTSNETTRKRSFGSILCGLSEVTVSDGRKSTSCGDWWSGTGSGCWRAGMNSSAAETRSALATDVVVSDDTLSVDLPDGRTIAAPLA